MMSNPYDDNRRRLRLMALLALVAGMTFLVACRKKTSSPSTKPAETQPATRPATATAPATQPTTATAPATGPAAVALPPCTYDSRPPYPVRLFVRKPSQDQPGWLRITELGDENDIGTCTGVFPRHNRIEIESGNVRELRLHISYLPLAEKKRIILKIDGQTMELARKRRSYVTLERGVTGAWQVAKSDD